MGLCFGFCFLGFLFGVGLSFGKETAFSEEELLSEPSLFLFSFNVESPSPIFKASFDKANPDLTAYVVGKAVDALFDQVAREEANIRANPLARTTDILKKVFGSR